MAYSPTSDVSSEVLSDKISSEPSLGKDKVDALIGQGVEFKGVIHYKGSVRIDGRLDGEIHTEGTLLVGTDATINAKISAGSVISKGRIIGDIQAKQKVLLLKSSYMEGTLNTPRLSMEEGVIFNGTIKMEKSRAKS